MKTFKKVILSVVAMAFAAQLSAVAAEETKDAKLKPYTLKTCIVSGGKLGEMGDPYVIKYEGREIKLCCKGCEADFKKDPAKFVKKIEAAEKKEAKKAPAK